MTLGQYFKTAFANTRTQKRAENDHKAWLLITYTCFFTEWDKSLEIETEVAPREKNSRGVQIGRDRRKTGTFRWRRGKQGTLVGEERSEHKARFGASTRTEVAQLINYLLGSRRGSGEKLIFHVPPWNPRGGGGGHLGGAAPDDGGRTRRRTGMGKGNAEARESEGAR